MRVRFVLFVAAIIISGCNMHPSKDPDEVARELILASGGQAQMQAMLDTMTSQMPYDEANAIRGLVNIDEFTSRLIPVYTKHFTVDEMNELIDFYHTKTGEKIRALGPTLVTEGGEVGRQYMIEKISAIRNFN